MYNKIWRFIMSLFDVDKTNADRGTPSPNSHDQIIDGAVKAHATHSINPVTNATTDTGYISNKNQQVLAFDGTANKALMGYNPGLDKWGMFVAQDGVDVTTNSDPANLIFNSSQDVFKIVASNSLTISHPSNGTQDNVAVAHGLSTIPAVVCFVSIPGFPGTQYGMPYGFFISSTNYLNANFWIDSTNVTFSISTGSATGSSYTGNYVFKYYILQETAN